jgi:PKD domain
MTRRLIVVMALAMLTAAPAAQAKRFFGGIVPDSPPAADVPTSRPSSSGPLARAAEYLPYGGGPVMHSNRTHVIFWAPSGSGLSFEPGYTSLVEQFLKDVAADSHKPSNPYGLSGQYHDSTGPAAYDSHFAGAVMDSDSLPANGCSEPPPPPLGTGPGWSVCLTAQQLENEIIHVVASNRLPQTFRDIYFLVTPNGLGSCESPPPDEGGCALGGDNDPGSYCGYHTATATGLLYAVIPFNGVVPHCQSTNPRPNASDADPTLSTLSHEHNEVVTDPFGDAWIDGSSAEDGDICLRNFGPALGGAAATAWNAVIAGHYYYLQEEFSNADRACEPSAPADRLSIALPRRARVLTKASFTAHGSGPQAKIVSYRWWFGDGTSVPGRSVKHAYKRAGRYRVLARATDSWGNWVFAAKPLGVHRTRRR